jgi:large subunit ribosomal protein L9
MKVILLTDVAKIGRRHEVAEVPDGYALNKLIPSRQAEPATPANLKKLRAATATATAVAAEHTANYEAAAAALTAAPLTVSVKVNEQGHMFAALSAHEVAAAAAATGLTLPEELIAFPAVVKDTGEHTIELTAGTERTPITINVVAA